MAVTAYNTWATVVHTATPTDLTAQNVCATVVHTATSTDLTAQNVWATVVHTATATDLTTQNVWATVVHTAGSGTAEYLVGQVAFRQPGLAGRFAFPFVPKIEK